jgi:hypothetical protein
MTDQPFAINPDPIRRLFDSIWRLFDSIWPRRGPIAEAMTSHPAATVTTPPVEPVTDLMAALEASLRRARATRQDTSR